MMGTIYTIGYSGYNNNPEDLIAELTRRNISVLIDVRSNPYSAHFYNFNKEKFSELLQRYNIAYRNYSTEFGAKQMNASYYSYFDGIDNRIDYDLFTKSEVFKNGINKVNQIYKKGYKAAIMCSEKDPVDCHRGIMISRALFRNYNYEVLHIEPQLPDESQKQLEARMKEKITSELKHQKKLNALEKRMKTELTNQEAPSLFTASDSGYVSDISNFYRIINSRIGWKYDEVLGYK